MEQELKKIIDQNKIISFDIFDTLLLRNVYQPDDIFRILEKEVKKYYDIEDFYNIRVSSELEARNNVQNRECNYDEIYNIIENKVGKKAVKIKTRELELEEQFITANSFMKKIFDYAIQKKKKVLCISDMYLEQKQISKLLKKAGYPAVPIFVSNEYRQNKGNQGLFRIAQEKMKLGQSNWLHIGDNIYSDYQQPIKFGINAYHYKNVREQSIYKKQPSSISEGIIRAIQNNTVYCGEKLDYWAKFGILYASPVYFGFTNWLYKMTEKKDNLFFLARDGYVIKQVYDKLKEKFHNDIYTNYIYSSRITYQIPAYLKKGKEHFLNAAANLPDFIEYNITLEYLLNSLGIDGTKYLEIIQLFGFQTLQDQITLQNQYQYRKFLQYIYDDLEKHFKEKRKILLQYLQQENMTKFDSIQVMDIGWGGSIQEAITLLTEKQVTGFYFGTIKAGRKMVEDHSFGYYFDMSIPLENFQRIWKNVMMWEFLFSAPHGTTIDFENKNGKIQPILDEENKTATKFMDPAIDIIDQYLQYYEYLQDFTPEDATKLYENFIQTKKYEDLIEFKNVYVEVLMGTYRDHFVKEFDKNFIKNHYQEFLVKKKLSIWPDAFLVKEAQTEEEQKYIMKKIMRKKENHFVKIFSKCKRILKKVIHFFRSN